MGRSSSSDSTSRSSRSSRREVKKSKKSKTERKSRHNSRSPDYRKRRSRSRSKERSRKRRSRSRSGDKQDRRKRKNHKSTKTDNYSRHSRSKRSRSREHTSRSRRSSASTAGSSADNSTDVESSDGSRRSKSSQNKISNKMYNNSTSQRSSRESSTLHHSRTENNSREGSHQEKLTVNNPTYESDANSDIKVIGIKQVEPSSKSNSIDVVAKLKMDSAIRDVESSSFEPKTFKSSRSQQNTIEVVGKKENEQFQFGTSAEKAATADIGISDKPISQVLMSIAGEGLCHQNLFEDPIKSDERWFEYLANLRKTIRAERHNKIDDVS